jgi:cell division protein FtsB
MLQDVSTREMIATYEQLRHDLEELERRSDKLDQEISQLESRLPDDYQFPNPDELAPRKPK